MDLTASPTTKTPDSENDTPHQPCLKPICFANGSSATRKHRRPSPTTLPAVAYKECLRNHAASMGKHALDGCGEFMPSADPAFFKCAACGCHRNFHRRDPPDDGTFSPTHTSSPHFIDFRNPFRRSSSSSSPSPSPPQPAPAPQHIPLPLTTAAPTGDTYHHNHHLTPLTPTAVKTENSAGRKRFRTKFTAEQKEKMHNFSENMGWKMQKADQASVEKFCSEIGVSRGVLKVWMHNNKNTLGKKDGAVINGGSIKHDGGVESNYINFPSSFQFRSEKNISGGDLNLQISTNNACI